MTSSRLPPIGRILRNRALASDLRRCIAAALRAPCAHLHGGRSIRGIFDYSLRAAIRDIENHRRGQLFRQLIEFGPADEEMGQEAQAQRALSTAECGSCVEFVYSHMVNRFKGELAELLALAPCLGLMERLQHTGRLPAGAQLFWGDAIQQPYRRGIVGEAPARPWRGFVKGADGLIVDTRSEHVSGPPMVRVLGVIEVKSMALPPSRLVRQVDRHLSRLAGGVRLAGRIWPASQVAMAAEPIRAVALPATWKLSREWRKVSTDTGWRLVLPKSQPVGPARVDELEQGLWQTTLGWSQEALEEAGYEMTFWYMSQVGQSVYTRKPLPANWTHMSPEEAGYNAIKEALYHLMLRPPSQRHDRLATRLYSVYSFGYPLGADSREMLWPEDFREAPA